MKCNFYERNCEIVIDNNEYHELLKNNIPNISKLDKKQRNKNIKILDKKQQEVENQIAILMEKRTNILLTKEFTDNIKAAEDKNKQINKKIQELKDKNRLNVFYRKTEYDNYETIENGTFKFSVGIFEKDNISICYSFILNPMLSSKKILGGWHWEEFANMTKAKVFYKEIKSYYIKYFQDEKPKVPSKITYSHLILQEIINGEDIVNYKGVKLDGYEVSDEEVIISLDS